MQKPPGFDDLFARVRAVAGALPDPRTGDNSQYSMADIALVAFSGFFTQCPSFLSFLRNMEQAHGRNSARSLFQVERSVAARVSFPVHLQTRVASTRT